MPRFPHCRAWRLAAACAACVVAGAAWPHAHPVTIDAADGDAWKYRLCGEMVTVAIQAVNDRDKGRPPQSFAADGGPGPAIANAIVERIRAEPQISSPKKATSFGRAFCMERLQDAPRR